MTAIDPVAETSSGRLWSATAFIAVAAAVVVTSKTSHADHIEPVNRFANLEWRTAWTTSRRSVCDATSSRPRGNMSA